VKNIILTIIGAIILVLLGCGLFVFNGTYNVAATSRDSGFMHWLLVTTREQSIERRAINVIPPNESVLNDPKTLRTGFEHYNEMCVGCHGAPGIEPGELREGLNPKPPILAKVSKQISIQELFWVIKHGIKMTGMPAWGPTHSDNKIWALVAFVKNLPNISPTQYKAMKQASMTMEQMHAQDEPGHHHEHN